MNNPFEKIFPFPIVLGKFSLVGIFGILINQGCLMVLYQCLHIDLKYASLAAIELSIIFNFLLNNFWTWSQGLSTGLFQRFMKYHLVTIVSGSLNYAVLLLLTTAGVNYFPANLLGIGLGMMINFTLNHNWTFKKMKKGVH
ncbi:MAG: GtrA family protein [Candidatus Marinimicrobia bacterium]|nr:GtrA family protein [Candidatus Neomarinimicrobiota bacterium]